MLRPVNILCPFCFLFCLNFNVPDIGFLGAQDMAKPFNNSHFITVDSVNFHYRIWNDTLKNPARKGFTYSWFHGFYIFMAGKFRYACEIQV